MTYQLKLYVPEGASPAARASAEARFRQALETALGDASLVAPVYGAVLSITAQYGESPDLEALTVDERTVLEHWQHAEAMAMEAVWGPHRHLDEGGYQISLES